MKKIVLLTLFTVFFYSINAQNNWLTSFGGSTADEVLDAATDQNGNILMTGYFTGINSFGSAILQSSGNSDVLIIKTNPTGGLIWAINAGGPNEDRATSITTDNSGNTYITGYFNSTATFGSITLTGQGRDAFVAKIDPNGTFLWAKAMGGQFSDTGYGVEVDNSGNVFCTGQYKGNGIFGSSTFNSTIDPTSGLPSHDIFLSKLNSSGTFLWTKDGKAKYDDKGIALTTDDLGNCYLTGQFSDTITFQNTYPNVFFNSGLIIKFDGNGNEQWVNFAQAGQVILNDIKWKGNNIYIGGDYIGNLTIEDINGISTYLSPHDYNVLVLKMTDLGDLNWLSSNYSENELYTKQLILDSNSDIYLTGLFKCSYDEMNQIYGNSTFLSLGYSDVHYMKYSNSGQFQWARQIGSQKDDYCASIVLNDIDFPILAGSFQNKMNVPSGQNFSYQTNQTNMTLQWANCANGTFGTFASQASNGYKDIFLTSPFDPNRLPYDYYYHEANFCLTDTIPPGIENSLDSLGLCYSSNGYTIGVNHFQTLSELSPLYNYEWNTGASSMNISFTQLLNANQTFYVDIERQDGCYAWTDTVVVTINPLPNPPLITDSWNYNINQTSPAINIVDCIQDTLFITATVDPMDTLIWSSNYDLINDSTTFTLTTNEFEVASQNSHGCLSYNSISVLLDDSAIHDTLQPAIIFSNITLQNTDSIAGCSSFNLVSSIFDNNLTNPDGSTPYKHTFWAIDGVFYDSIYHNSIDNQFGQTDGLIIQNSGWHTISAHLVNNCGDTVNYFIERTFHVSIIPTPQLTLSQNSLVCIGDTVTLYAQHYQDSVLSWVGPNIIAIYGDSADVIAIGLQDVYQVQIDTVAHGHTCPNFAWATVSTPLQPEIVMFPLNGIICPGDSILLTALDGVAWQWIGPNNSALGTNQNQYIESIGNYHCIITLSNGCILTSNYLETTSYNSPFFIVEPGVICNGDSVEIEIFSTFGTLINWQAPLFGNSNIQYVNSAGIYYFETSFCNITTLDSVSIIEPNPIANFNFGGDTVFICPLDTFELEAITNSNNITWSDQSTDSVQSITLPGNYFFNVELNGCYAYSDTITIIEQDYLTFNDNLNQTICFGQSTMLSIDAAYQTVWLDQNLDTLSTLNSISTGVLFDTVSYTVSISQIGFCPIIELSNINVVQSEFSPSYSINDSICVNDVISIQASEQYDNYTWTQNDMFVSANYFTNIPTFTEGLITVELFVDVSGCNSDTVTIDISVYANPNIMLSSDTIFCFDQSLQLNSNTYQANYDWITHPNPQYDSLVIYTIINDMGCTYTDSMNISYQTCNLNSPNVFSPNNDFINDIFYFEIPNGEIKYIRIFNRWENLIYESDSGEWGGYTNNGVEASDGVYFYIVDYETFNSTFHQKQGYVTLIR